MSLITCDEACCFRKSKFFPYSCSTSWDSRSDIYKLQVWGQNTHSAVLLVILESTSQVFQATFCHTCQTNKNSICNIGPDAMYKSRVSRKKIHNTWCDALRYCYRYN